MYATTNFKTKKELKEAVASGKLIGIRSAAPMFPAPSEGMVTVEGPWYPQPHRWYAQVELKLGIIVKVK